MAFQIYDWSLSEAIQPQKSDIDSSIGNFVFYIIEHQQRQKSLSRHYSQSVLAVH